MVAKYDNMNGSRGIKAHVVLETECWLGQAPRPSFQIPASFSKIFIIGCWTRLTTHPIGTTYLKLGDLGEAEAAYCAVKAHCPSWNIRYISPRQFALKLQPENSKCSHKTISKAKYLCSPAKYDNVHRPLDVELSQDMFTIRLSSFSPRTPK